MTLSGLMEWAFLGMLAGGVSILWQMKNSMQEMNVKLAVILERIDGHEKRLTRLEEKP